MSDIRTSRNPTKVGLSSKSKSSKLSSKTLQQTPSPNDSKDNSNPPQQKGDVYCTAEPGSDEWKEYQAQRLMSLKTLKHEKDSAAKALKLTQQEEEEDSSLQTILKKKGSKKSPSRPIRWKVPVDDEEETEDEISKRESRQKVKPTGKKSSTKSRASSEGRTSTAKAGGKSPSKKKLSKPANQNRTTGKTLAKIPSKKSLPNAKALTPVPITASKSSSAKALLKATAGTTIARTSTASASKSSVKKPLIPASTTNSTSNKDKRPSSATESISRGVNPTQRQEKGASGSGIQAWASRYNSKVLYSTSPTSSSHQLASTSLDSILSIGSAKDKQENLRPAQRKPPKFPSLKVCDVFPGTPEWDEYWDTFNRKLSTYNKAMDDYGKGIDEFTKDLNDYSRELKRITMEDRAFQAQLGMRPFDKKPPILRKALTEPITMIGGFVIRNVNLGHPIILTTFDHISFRLEVPFNDAASYEAYSVNTESKSNLMTIKINDRGAAQAQEIQIVATNGKDIEDLRVGAPLHNGGKLIICG